MVRKKTKYLLGFAIIALIAILFISGKIPLATYNIGSGDNDGIRWNSIESRKWVVTADITTATRGDIVPIRLFAGTMTDSSDNFCAGSVKYAWYPVFDEKTRPATVLEYYGGGTRPITEDVCGGWERLVGIDTKELSAGEHIIDIFYKGEHIGKTKRFGIEGFEKNPTTYQTSDTWIAATKIFIQPAVCLFDAKTDGAVSEIFTAGDSVSRTSLKYTPTKFCDSPTRILRADTGAILSDYKITASISNGETLKVPPSQAWELIYIAKKTWDATCVVDSTYSAEQNECVVSGFTRPCGDKAILQKDGTCIEFPTSVCPGGTVYNATVNPDACIIDRCPQNSQWYETINACAKRIPYSSLCGTGATYSNDVGGCIQNAYTGADGNAYCQVVGGMWSGTDNDVNSVTYGQFVKTLPTAESAGCLAQPAYQCSVGSQIAKDENSVFYCQYGLETYKVCPVGTSTEQGACIATKTLIVEKVVIEKEVIEREVPAPYEVIKKEFVSFETTILGLSLIYWVVLLFIIVIVLAGVFYVYKR